ncbi:disease resistance protein RPV1-like [Diospyros lotus]|uniref:disease resistance protein RPV1-like n=1 Tax=Diospyros lotus TaxID=55363 RepID=UPI00225BA061|nr:disease resistance protein RPV1-like [Diospyros lotus]
MAASSSSPIPPPMREYNVFLNFSGPDTRETIISHLRVDLERNNFHTFRDDKNLDRGQSIGPGLLEAIEDSSMSLVVFSKNYFASSWCLRELEKIMKCRNNSQHFVLPIFYKIEPSDIRHLNGSIAETLAKTLAKHEELPKMENWRAILTEVANLSGIVSSHYRDEASLVKDIVKEVQRKLNLCIDLNVATHLVGIESRLQKLLKKLCLESSDDVRIIAIWGVNGLGKTTIAKAAYNCIRSRFEGYSFVANVREKWEQSNGDLLTLQNQIRYDISKNKSYKIRNSHEGVEFLKRRAFYGRKVLIVLDDVDRVKQLNALAIDPKFLYRGSRIIVTARDISSLNSFQSALTIYELEHFNMDEYLQLFSLHAFNEHYPPEDFMELSNTVVDYAGGIPLVLEVWGSFLNGKNHSEWRDATIKLKKIPHGEVQRILRISFDSLDEKEKKSFLDIACFFDGESKNFAIQVLEACEFFPVIGLRHLEDLCLLKYDPGHAIVMHDILKQMGKEIIRQENVDFPRKRSRLWDSKDALKVLKNCEGTETVEGLILFHNGKDFKVKAKAFQKMTGLRVLHLNHVLLSPGNKLLFENLVWLRWHHFDLSVLPSQLYLENLDALDLSYSNIKRVWRGTKVLGKLKFLDLSCCDNLTTTPNFSGLPNLEKLILSQCVRLQEVDKSIRHLNKLLVLDLSSCRRIRKLPMEIAIKQDWRVIMVLSQLKFLNLGCCRNLTTTLNFSWLPNLEKLILRNCVRLEEVDKSIGHLQKLRVLDLNNCTSLRELPSEMANLKSLEYLIMHRPLSQCQTSPKGSTGFFRLPLNFGVGLRCLKWLQIHGYSLTQLPGSEFGCLPESICNLTELKGLTIKNCNLTNLPSEIGRLNRLEVLNLQGNNFCSLPESIGELTNLRDVNLSHCERLQSLPKLSGRGGPDSFVTVSNCPSLESISLESIMNYKFMSCYNCPKLYEKDSADKIGTRFFNYKGALLFRIGHSGGMFPDWLQHETTNSYYALKVPSLGVGNKHFIRCILYAVHVMDIVDHLSWPMVCKLHNKSKDVCNYFTLTRTFSREWTRTFIGDQIILCYTSFPVYCLQLKEGDEIEVSWTCENMVLKKWGIHVSYYTLDDHHQ